MLGADRLCRAQALVGVGRWHPDIDDGDVREMFPSGSQQGVRVADLSNDVESRVDQKSRDAFTNEHRVVGKDQPHGHSRSANRRMAGPEIRSLGMKPTA